MSAQLLLLNVPKDHASVREERAAACASLKARFNIVTNGNGDAGPSRWIAFCVPECHASPALSGYLDDKDRADPWEMFFSYCRLIEEADLISDGATEFEAVSRCAARQLPKP